MLLPEALRHGHAIAIAAFAAAAAGCGQRPNLVGTPPHDAPPIAVIDASATQVAPLAAIDFDGAASHDPDGTVVAWHWSVVSWPGGEEPAFTTSGAGGVHATLTPLTAGDYTIKLTVVDDGGKSGSATYDFAAVPTAGIHVELTWDTDHSDVDLHFVDQTGGGSFFQAPLDCYFANLHPNWGSFSSTADDPSLDRDDIDGWGPENLSLAQPEAGHLYRIYVHYFHTHGAGPTGAIVRIWENGALVWESAQELDVEGRVWDVATISWPDGAVTAQGDLSWHSSP